MVTGSYFTTEIVFKCRLECGFGEEVRISGNIVDLGLNDPQSAIPLVTTPSEYPTWKSQTPFVFRDDPDKLEFRFCLYSGGIFKRWETVQKRLLRHCLACVKGLVEAESTFDQPQKVFGGLKLEDPIVSHFRQRVKIFEKAHSEVNSDDTVISVSYFLPVNLSKTANGEWCVQKDHDHILSFEVPKVTTFYVGSVQYNQQAIPSEERKTVTAFLRKYNCFPVFVEDDEHSKIFKEFCGQTLKPQIRRKTNVYTDLVEMVIHKQTAELWLVYNEVLHKFRSKVIEAYQPGNLIWIHGYELMLLPSKVRRKIMDAKIGYCLHMPFPAADVWNQLDQKENMLRGMLGANAIGFPSSRCVRHFTSICNHLLGYNHYYDTSGRPCLNVDGNEVVLTAIHKGIDYTALSTICDTPEFWSKVEPWATRFAGKKVAVGLIKLSERLKFTSIRFSEISRFLEHNPQWHNKVVFSIVAATPAVQSEIYRCNVTELRAWAKLLNDRYGSEHVVFDEFPKEQLHLADRLAYFAAADLMFMTVDPLGTLQFSMEFTVATSKRRERCYVLGQTVPNSGAVILSASHAATKNLAGAITHNTREPGQLEQAIMMALNSDQSDSTQRLYHNLSYCALHTASMWAVEMLNDLKSTTQTKGAPNLLYVTSLGSFSFVRNLIGEFKALDKDELFTAYRKTHNRLIIFDGESLPAIDTYQKSIIEALCADKRNLVFMVSGKSPQSVEERFGGFKYLGLAAEDGFYFRWPVHKFVSSKMESMSLLEAPQTPVSWQNPMFHLDTEWQAPTIGVMELFTRRTVRSYIEPYQHAVYWQYGDVDPQTGFFQSRQLIHFLSRQLVNHEVDILRGVHYDRKYILVRSKKVSKSNFLENVLLTLRSMDIETDFILVAGDDDSDEPLFAAANEMQMPVLSGGGGHQKACFTTAIGRKRTAARTLVDSSDELLKVLRWLSHFSTKETKFHSTSDLPRAALEYTATQDRKEGTAPTVEPTASSGGANEGAVVTGATPPIRQSRSAPQMSQAQAALWRGDRIRPVLAENESSDRRESAPFGATTVDVTPVSEKHSASVGEYLNQMAGEEEEPLAF